MRQVGHDPGDEIAFDGRGFVAFGRDAAGSTQQPIYGGEREAHVQVHQERTGQALGGHHDELGRETQLAEVVVEDELVRAGELDHDCGSQE